MDKLWYNTLRCEQNGNKVDVTDDIFKWNLLKENCCIFTNNSLKFVLNGLHGYNS